jgi:hypothetical protein
MVFYQLDLYSVWLAFGEPQSIYRFDPRMGLFLLESRLRETVLASPALLSWASVAPLFAASLLIRLSGRGLKLYLAFESLLSVPTIIVFAMIIITRIGSPEGFPIFNLAAPLAVFTIFSLVPFGEAVRILAGAPSDLSIAPSARSESDEGANLGKG